MLYGYGYTESFNSLSTQTVAESYIARNDHNILIIEWSNYSNGSYVFDAIPNSKIVGEILGKTLLRMKSEGFNIDTFHLVGHSLGSHLVAFVARSFYTNSNKTLKLKKVTGFDPAGPLFYWFGNVFIKPINMNDGEPEN